MIKLKSLLNKLGYADDFPNSNNTLNENLMLQGEQLKNQVDNFVKELVSSGTLGSFHREKSSGDMQPQDFTGDLVHKLLSAIEEWSQTVNNRGDWENQEGGMIKEVSCKKCGNKCDLSSLNEVAMGAVRCPSCNEIMDQEGNVYGR